MLLPSIELDLSVISNTILHHQGVINAPSVSKAAVYNGILHSNRVPAKIAAIEGGETASDETSLTGQTDATKDGNAIISCYNTAQNYVGEEDADADADGAEQQSNGAQRVGDHCADADADAAYGAEEHSNDAECVGDHGADANVADGAEEQSNDAETSHTTGVGVQNGANAGVDLASVFDSGPASSLIGTDSRGKISSPLCPDASATPLKSGEMVAVQSTNLPKRSHTGGYLATEQTALKRIAFTPVSQSHFPTPIVYFKKQDSLNVPYKNRF